MAKNILEVEGLSFWWGEQCLFEDLNFSMEEGQRVALIAKNGAGKTTLFNMISREGEGEQGRVSFLKGIKVSYLMQDPLLDAELNVLQTLFQGDTLLTQVVRNYTLAVASGNTDEIQRYIEEMDKLDGWDYEHKAKTILSRLRITDFNQRIKELSGGQRKRVALAAVLLQEPDLLLLDEPTNHLDLDMVEWLEQYLQRQVKTLFMITHDRFFLDRVCNEILELDEGCLHTYRGNYSYFLEKQEERLALFDMEVEKARAAMKSEQEWIRRMPKARATKAKYRVEAFDKLKAKASQTRQVQQVDIQMKSSRLGRKIMEVHKISKCFGEKVLLSHFSYVFHPRQKVGIIGENGSGKSTFLNIITQELAPDAGSIDCGSTVKIAYFRQEEMSFNDSQRVIDVIADISESIPLGDGRMLSPIQYLNHFLFPPHKHHIQVGKLSGGERRRLYLMTVLMGQPNFLILDEPTNDLDIITLSILEDYLKHFDGSVLIVSHDRYFMDEIVDHLLVFHGDAKIENFPGNYTQYRTQLQEEEKMKAKEEASLKAPKVKPQEKSKPYKLSFKEKKELEGIEDAIARLEEEKVSLELALSSGTLNNEELFEVSQKLQTVLEQLEKDEERWLELSELS